MHSITVQRTLDSFLIDFLNVTYVFANHANVKLLYLKMVLICKA